MTWDASSVEPEFTHRHHDDGTIDSICLRCYLTVCSCPGASACSCASAERKHECNPDDVARFESKIA